MGTIVIEEYAATGSYANPDVPVRNLSCLIARTADATTSTTAETITLNKDTNYIRVYTAEIHRLATVTDLTASLYTTTVAAQWVELGVKPGTALYYRTDA